MVGNATMNPGDKSPRRCAARASWPGHRRADALRTASCLRVACAALAILASPAGRAQTEFRCAPLLPSATRAPAYERVAGERRCEGFFDQTVSQAFVELLSLTRHRPDRVPAVADAPLQLRGGTARTLVIQPLRPSPFYRVDAALAPDQPLSWNAAPMLKATGLRLADLGFLARRAAPDADASAVVPVSLPAAVDDPATAYAVLRVSVPVASIAARRYRIGDAAGAVAGDWQRLPGTPLDAWDTIVLPIALPTDGQPVSVDVRAIDKGGGLLPLLHFVVAAP